MTIKGAAFVRIFVIALAIAAFASAAGAQTLPGGFVFLRDIDPSIIQDIRYAGANNFVGRRLSGYEAAECVVKRGVGLALQRAQRELAPQRLSSGRNIFEQLGEWFSLLAFDVDDSVILKFETTAKALRIPLSIIQDSFADGRKAYEHRLVLVRPDHFVAWAGDNTPADVRDLLVRVTGRS